MLAPELRQSIIELIHQQVVPAIGCTEPICVALATAKATENMRAALVEKGVENDQEILPETLQVLLSANILKNAMGVGIPGTGMVGLPIAIALGSLVGKSEYGLEVLRDSNSEWVERGKALIETGGINIALATPEDYAAEGISADEKLFVSVTVTAPDGTSGKAVIAHQHTAFLDCKQQTAEPVQHPDSEESRRVISDAATTTEFDGKAPELTLKMVYEFASTTPIEEIEFINEAARLNMNAANESLEHNYGHCLGKALHRPLGRGILGDSIFSHVLMATSSACDARMAGAMIPVMSNSGSGNQGICATNPVVVFARENHNTHDELIRALTLSHLTAIYIKQHLGSLSALCGCVVASTGSSVGITYLMGGNYEQISAAVKNMIANLTGMICDGAKPSCALKLTTGVSTAILSAMLAMQGECVTSVEGIIDDCVDRSIRNLATIGKDAMNETDRCVLDIMTSK